MATLSDPADKVTIKRVVLEEGTATKARTIGKEYTPGAGTAEVIINQDELILVLKGLCSLEMFSNPRLLGNDNSTTALEKWYVIRRLIDDLAIIDWTEM